MDKLFKCKSPCKNCPYLKSSPLRLWDIEEFKKLYENQPTHETGFLTNDVLYMCHKNNGTICRGWLMNQDENNFPSIVLRLSLSKHKVTRDYLDNLFSSGERFKTVAEMCIANYPEVFNNK